MIKQYIFFERGIVIFQKSERFDRYESAEMLANQLDGESGQDRCNVRHRLQIVGRKIQSNRFLLLNNKFCKYFIAYAEEIEGEVEK